MNANPIKSGLETPTDSEKTVAALMHVAPCLNIVLPGVGVVLPLVLWLIKKDDSPYLNRQGKEAVNFMIFYITLIFAIIGGSILSGSLLFTAFFLSFLFAAWLTVLSIIATIKVSQGKIYDYPFIFRIIS